MMLIKDYKLMDEVIDLIRSKDDTKSYFKLESLYKFEFKFLLCLDIVRYQLQLTGKITDRTADAIAFLFAFGTFEYYYRDFPGIHEKCSILFGELEKYNERLISNSLPGDIGVNDESWASFFQDTIGKMVMW